MTTYDLRQHELTVDELLRLAADMPIHVIAKDGQTFVIEPADDFEQEVARLRQSEQFMAFLAERSTKKQGSVSLDEFDREIDEALAREASPSDE
jgi:hypothetical protein